MENEDGKVHYYLLNGKRCFAPMKFASVPQLARFTPCKVKQPPQGVLHLNEIWGHRFSTGKIFVSYKVTPKAYILV